MLIISIFACVKIVSDYAVHTFIEQTLFMFIHKIVMKNK